LRICGYKSSNILRDVYHRNNKSRLADVFNDSYVGSNQDKRYIVGHPILFYEARLFLITLFRGWHNSFIINQFKLRIDEALSVFYLKCQIVCMIVDGDHRTYSFEKRLRFILLAPLVSLYWLDIEPRCDLLLPVRT
jgi:hypothetical protein